MSDREGDIMRQQVLLGIRLFRMGQGWTGSAIGGGRSHGATGQKESIIQDAPEKEEESGRGEEEEKKTEEEERGEGGERRRRGKRKKRKKKERHNRKQFPVSELNGY